MKCRGQKEMKMVAIVHRGLSEAVLVELLDNIVIPKDLGLSTLLLFR